MSDEEIVAARLYLDDGFLEVMHEPFIGVSISYNEEDLDEIILPALTKSQWGKLKRAGDYVFGEIGGEV